MDHTRRIMASLVRKSQLYESKIWLLSIIELTKRDFGTRSQVEDEILRRPQLSLEVIFRCYAFARGGGADKADYHRISVNALRKAIDNFTFEEFVQY